MKKIIAVQFTRKRKNQTDYRKRLKLLVSGKPRLVVRRTATQFVIQLVEFKESGDLVKVTVSSADLKKLGWKRSSKSLPAAYLTGMLVAKKAAAAKISEAVVDLGLSKPSPRGRYYAALKGALDGGLKISVSEEVLPAEERFTGAHISEDVAKAFSDVKTKIGGES